MKKLIWFIASIVAVQAHAQISRQWVATYNGTGDFNDRYTCIAKDAAGNLYVGGSTTNPGADRDFLILKIDINGTVLWNKQLNGPAGDGPDEVTAIAVDNLGNVYATGLSKGDNTSEDYLTVKLNGNGDTLWTRRYDFAAEYDQANAIFVDAAGNVYVTGQSDRDSSAIINDDYATIKYSSDGARQWVQRFNGFGNAIDRAVSVLTDNQSNVYVTGRSDNGSDDDYATIKYNAAGVQQWIKFDDRGGRDRAVAMAIDAGNNIVVTGRSDNGDNDDFWTLKYNSNGVLQWQNAFDFVDQDRPAAIALDATGNVYVTGQSDQDFSPQVNWDYLTVAYGSAGNALWSKRFDGAVSNNDFATAIATDGAGTVYVTGLSGKGGASVLENAIVTLSYNATNGVTNWTATYAGTVAGDNTGNAVVALATGCAVAGFSEDFTGRRNAATIRYNAGGNLQWLQTFNGIGDNNENVRALAVDDAGNVFAAGYSVGDGNNRDMALVKFNSAGQSLCAYTLNGSATGSVDDAQGLALDASGNPVVAGVVKNSGTSNDIALIRMGALCDTLWTKTLDGPGHGSDRVYDLVKDAAGNLYITGRMDVVPGAAANDNCYTAKLDANGNILWAQTYENGPADRGIFVRVAPGGEVYVAGRSLKTVKYEIFLIKYAATGAQQWVKTYSAGAGRNAEPKGMTLDAQGNILLCGITETATDSVYDYLAIKYAANGSELWTKTYNGAGNGDDQPQAMAVDGVGNVYIAGRSDTDPSAAQNFDMVTLKLNPAGVQLWQHVYAGATNADDTPDDIAVDGANSVYLTGHTNTGTLLAPNYDIVTVVLGADGSAVWSEQYHSLPNANDVPNLLYMDGNDFYVAGSTELPGQQRDMLVLKYTIAVGTSTTATDAFRVYPNPFGNILSVRATTAAAFSGATFELTDVLGNVVFSQNLVQPETAILISDLPEGAYFYHVMSAQAMLNAGKLFHKN